ncbi:hypothetical protein J4573_33075 [Actinomadura barringtoniae]|uniref:Subtilisin inhibitor domain-containing protein n=1 Tax=Actinomadura barringtoniae TaxID=1427535 RepID=A0A939PG06_9ACTN|nr:SSI family serine proteinase inhibitor [Actinomadura barringtoniae]MBO2451961.1 hypothetical protein [Actinomadura barringtoniae]
MRKRRAEWLITTLAVALPLAAATAPARAQVIPGEPEGAYVLMVILGNSAPTRTNTLLCDPDGGTHVTPVLTCDQLRDADGEVGSIPADPGPCTKVYDPVRVSVHGIWRGHSRHFTKVYGNQCEAIRSTGGSLFSF